MANVWKIGSRWSYEGSWESRIISIFRRSGVVFLGEEKANRFSDEVKEGDYFAIADGYCIPAVAKAVSSPIKLSEMINKNMIKVREGEPFDLYDDYSLCYGVKVKIVDLPENNYIYYPKRGTFFRANSIAEEVVRLYEGKESQQFDIEARTYRIMSTHNNTDNKYSIINNNTLYNIPVYQREYSWGEIQISRFIGDVFKGFWGADENKFLKMEPLFIGTMQLSFRKYIKENEYEQDVIDGQQRLSTILCILKYLKIKYPQNETLQKVSIHWMETKVNNGKEDRNLSTMLNLISIDDLQSRKDYFLNSYLRGIEIIKEIFEEYTTDEERNPLSFFEKNVNHFIDYFLNNVYFVVVETLAGLSKTIQIFNTINTAGLDLSGNDLFKVRLYEYLHDKRNQGEEAFNEIGELYKTIKEKNIAWRINHNWDVITVEQVRSVYKNYLISKYQLRTSLYAKATDTFFDELFDTLLNVQIHEEMRSVLNSQIILSIDDLRRIENVVYFWNSSDFRTKEEFLSYTLIMRSRYSRYIDIVYQVLLTNEHISDAERLDQVYELLLPLSKLFFCWSIKYAKVVYDMHNFMYELYRDTKDFQNNRMTIYQKIQSKTNTQNNDDFKNNCLGAPIAHYPTIKNLICILSDYFDEVEQETPLSVLQDLYNGFDIEHIHANANDKEAVDIDEELQNCIGNLMLLEYDINRSIGCQIFNEKRDSYRKSKYATVNKIAQKNQWSLQDVMQRRKEEIVKISKYLFD